MKDMGNYERLTAYQRSVTLADDLRREIDSWPAIDQRTVGLQLVRSADSVGANIAEAFGRGSDRDQMRFLLIARGSAYETQHWIERAIARDLLSTEGFRARAGAVGQFVNGPHRAIRRRVQATSD